MPNYYCSVPGCNSWGKRSPELSFHAFPKQGSRKVRVNKLFGSELLDQQKAWIHALKIGKPITPYMRVCSLHFREEDFFYSNEQTQKKRLKGNVVPSQKLPQTSLQQSATSATEAVPSTSGRQARYARRANQTEPEHTITSNQSTSATDNEVPLPVEQMCSNASVDCTCEDIHTREELDAANALLSFTDKPHLTVRDFEVQVDIPQLLTISTLIKSDKHLSTLTGLQSFDILNHLIFIVNTIYTDTKLHKLNIRERIILTFCKFKHNLSNSLLAILFGISITLVKTYITDMIHIMSSGIDHAIVWKQMSEIMKNIPGCFQEFLDTQVVLDCTEIKTQSPKCLCCRIKFYSYYKSSSTVKFMTGVSPAGLITFISKAYGGRAGDKSIFIQSEIFNKVEPGMAVMVDKGFLIDDICRSFNIKIHRPPFLKKGKKLTPEEAIFNRKIAAARVHIERSNQRLKVFKILSGTLQWCFVPQINEIFKIIAAVTNLSSPILSDDKF